MKTVSIILLVITTSSILSSLCLLSSSVSSRRRNSIKKTRYTDSPAPSTEMPEEILQEDAAVYDIWDRKANELLQNFKDLMEEEKPYLDPKASIESISARMGTNKTTLSKMINDKFGMNFRQLLNSYRVKEAIHIFSRDNDISMEDLRVASGFNSVSTFTSSFSRFTGCTPGEYCKKISGR